MPLYVYPEDVVGSVAGSSGPPRIIGYPNVVLALDPNKINPRAIPGLPALTADTLLDTCLSFGVLRRNPDDPLNSYLLSNSNDDSTAVVVSRNTIQSAYNSVLETLKSGQSAQEVVSLATSQNPELGAILNAVLQSDLSNIEDDENLSRYMALQRGLKSVFGVGKNIPDGEYRYFSSSAPDPEDQAPGEYLFDQETMQSSTTQNGPPSDSLNTITVLRQVGDRIRLESGMPTVGFRVFGISAPDDDNASPYVTITTRDIRFLNFTRYGVRIPTTVQSVGVSNLAAFSLNTSQVIESVRSVLLTYAQQEVASDPNVDIETLFGVEEADAGYGGVYNAITAFANALGVSSELEVSIPLQQMADIENTFTPFQKGSTTLTKRGSLKEVTGFVNIVGLSKITPRIAQSLASLVDVVQTAYRNRVGSDGVPNANDIEARTAFLSTLPGYRDAGSDSQNTTQTQYTEKGSYTAVLPVSDNRGYEVYGTMAYGRGLNIKSYRGVTEAVGSPTVSGSMLSVEQFFATLAVNGGDVAKALSAIPPETKAELAASLNTEADGLQGVIEGLRSSEDSETLFIRNTPVTSRSRGMSNTINVSSAELAALTVGEASTCLCKGSEASHFIQAFTGNFVELSETNSVNTFLQTEAQAAGEMYTVTKQALAGQVLDTRYGAQLGRSVRQNLADFQTGLGDAVEAFTEARAELSRRR